MKTKIKVQLDHGAAMPTRAHDTDVGYDVKALRTWLVQGDGTEHPINTPEDIRRARMLSLDCAKVKIDTGVHVQPEPGFYVELVPNSRLAKTPFMYANSFGVIDPAYTGSMRVILNCVNSLTPDDLLPFMPGKVVGQLIIRERISADFEQVDELEDTERGSGGFGSTAERGDA
jgi:dUTP pyrophosphatase